ncbi:Flp pilus assembly protein CpaB [Halofilum ochraceum]|uniref:Flp pilus assembly protein CpaB n=1 Tax=Halofilum ochraceum TaxID=1611323 RepID=UPI0008D9B544|nr:Flp pilus assembly protein CpaB [Halofilum ochraceum]
MKKSTRLVSMLGVSLVMALGAALLAKHWLQDRLNVQAAPAADTRSVVAATRDIPFAQTIESTDLQVIELPHHAIPKGSFVSIDDVAGAVATQTIYGGEVVVGKRIGKNLGGSALAVVVDKGKRAISVRVNDVVGVAGFLLPGNRVDVLASKGAARRDVSSETILTDIKVLAVDQIVSPEKDEPVIVRAVTLEVTPTQAEKIVKATREGEVQLTLRNPLDQEPDVKPEPEPQKVVKRTVYRGPKHVHVQVIRGTDVSSERVKE